MASCLLLPKANRLKPGANPELIKSCTRQADERANPALQELEGAKFQGKRMGEITLKLHG